MTTSRKFFRHSRPYLLASIAGCGLCGATLLPAQAPALVPAVADSAEPRRLPDSPNEARPLNQQPVALTAGQTAGSEKSEVQKQLELLYQQNGQPMPNMPHIPPMQQKSGEQATVSAGGVPARQSGPNPTVHTQAGGQVRTTQAESGSKQVGFIDRFSSAFRRTRVGKNPPVDPGMSYPTASQQKNQVAPPPVPGVAPGAIPAVPPVPGVANSSQPGFFQPPAGANPISSPVVPGPGATPVSQPKNIGQLKQMLQADNSPAAGTSQNPIAQQTVSAPQPQAGAAAIPDLPPIPTAPPTIAGSVAQQPVPQASDDSGSLPVLDFNAPLPENHLTVAPAEPSEPATSPAATAALPPAPGNEDPFNDLFPDDAKTAELPQAPMPPSTQVAEQQATQPYTGLSLEDDLFLKSEAPAQNPNPSGTIEVKVAAQPAESTSPSNSSAVQPQLPAPETGKPLPALTLDLPAPQEPVPPPVAAPAQTPKAPISDPNIHLSKMERIAARKGQTGLKGFCPVMLRDDRELVDSHSEFSVIYNGKRYECSSAAAMETFLSDPHKYVPASAGNDVIHLALTGERQPGSLDHAVWYKGRLYLFSGVETMETFVAAPSGHASEE